MAKSDLLTSKRIEGSNLVLVEHVSCFLADHLRRCFEWLVVHCVDLPCRRLASRHDCGEEAHANRSPFGYFKLALALDPLLEFFLSNALHQFKQPGLGTFDVQQGTGKLIFIERDDVGVELPDIKHWSHLVVVWHRKQLNVDVQTCQVFGPLDGQVEIVATSWHVTVREDEDPLAE